MCDVWRIEMYVKSGDKRGHVIRTHLAFTMQESWCSQVLTQCSSHSSIDSYRPLPRQIYCLICNNTASLWKLTATHCTNQRDSKTETNLNKDNYIWDAIASPSSYPPVSERVSGWHSWKKCFCLRDPVFWGGIFLILRRNFPNMDEDFPNIEEKFS